MLVNVKALGLASKYRSGGVKLNDIFTDNVFNRTVIVTLSYTTSNASAIPYLHTAVNKHRASHSTILPNSIICRPRVASQIYK